MRARRVDPDRRGRILQATLEVIAEGGVSAATHRAIAARADVPLGSMTYYFSGLDDVLREATRLQVARVQSAWAERLAGAVGAEGLAEALTELVAESTKQGIGLALTIELLLAGRLDPDVRALHQEWVRASVALLVRHVDAVTAQALLALAQGLALRETMSPPTASGVDVRATLLGALKEGSL